MRHRKAKSLLNRFTSWRKATLLSLARNVLINQSIRTTRHNAKVVRPLVEKLISLGKSNTLTAKRQAARLLGNDHTLVNLLFKELAPRFSNRQGGYTRIINLGQRRGDNAQIVILELTEIKKKEKKARKKEKEAKTQEVKETGAEVIKERPVEVKKPDSEVAVKEKPPITKKPSKKFLGGIRNIFKKERRDSL